MKISGPSAPHPGGQRLPPVPEKPANVQKPHMPQSGIMKPSAVQSSFGSKDQLSALINTFARFFSLPLKPELLAKIRLAAKNAQTHTGARHEALSLAATIAADKGVELSPAALEKYASTVSLEPDQQEEAETPKDTQKPAAKNPDITSLAGDPSKLKEHILQTAEQDPLLRLLNQLPGRNGQRWLTLPFNFNGGGGEYRACLKVLLDGTAGQSTGAKARQMALEVAKIDPENAADQRRLFILTPCSGRDQENGTNLRLRICQQGDSNQKTLVSGLSERLDILPEHISIQNFINVFPLETDNDNEELFSVNEEV